MPDDVAASVLHPLLSSRWSPTTFDAAHELTDTEVALLLEAARWAPSAGNSQPWAFIVGCRGDDTHERLVRHLAGSSARWAPTASLLVANLSHRYVEDPASLGRLTTTSTGGSQDSQEATTGPRVSPTT